MILRPGDNVWRVEQASRAAVLIDAAAYFRAVREALIKARHSVFIVGWDIHSQTRLVGESGEANDGYPALFAEFLSELVRRRRELEIRLLLWDYSLLYATERELFPTLTLRWNTPSRVLFCLDDAVPLGSSQHQKLIVIDDAIAFSGGLDVTVRRWDTPAHELNKPARVDPAGKPYAPFHDVQALVDGAAARALAELARARWNCVADVPRPPPPTQHDPWPDSVRPDFTGVEVGIARTQPRYEEQKEIREVEKLFLDGIDAAENRIYVENQFLTCTKIAERLARRLRERPGLEALLVTPHGSESWLEAHAMGNARLRFAKSLRQPDIVDRVRLLYPEVSDGTKAAATMIHSKIMIVDDRLLRVGSANLNNRSMGTDTECDLIIEANGEAERRRIAEIRNTLLGEHCGTDAAAVAAALARSGSLLRVADQLTRNGHRLRPIEDREPDLEELSSYLESVGDPEKPIGAQAFVSTMLGGHLRRRQTSTIVKVGGAALLILLLALAWQYTPLARFAEPNTVRETLTQLHGPWTPFFVLAVFVAGGLVAFPVLILIAATAAAFGPWPGLAYATAGALTSALVTFAIGAKLGKDVLRDILGPRLNRIREKIAQEGVLAVALVRVVPLAPFTVVNLVAGASDIKLTHFMLGTLLGMAPGLLLMSALGHQISRILVDPTATDIALLVVFVVLWIAVSIGVQAVVSKYWSART
jgi:phospholipase D1/2